MRRIISSGSVLFSVSQGFSSLSNLLIGIGLSRNMPIAEFGLISIVLTFVYFSVSLQRSAIGDTSIIFTPTNEGISRAAVRLTLLAACFVFAAMVSLELMFPAIYPYFVPFLGGILVAQDGLRYGLVAIDRRVALLIGDILWVTNSGLVLLLMGVAGLTLDEVFRIWIAAALLICLFAWLQFQSAAPAGISVMDFKRITSKVSGWSALQFIAGNGSVLIAITLFAAAVGASDFAGYRATQMVLSPIIVGTLALSSPLLSFIVTRHNGGWSKAQAFQSSAALGLAVAALGAVAVWLGRWLIEMVPGEQYVEYSNLLLPGALALVFVAANVPIASSLLSLMKGRAFFLASVGATVPTSALVVWSAFEGGAEFAVWSMAVQYAAVTASCAFTLGFTGVRSRSGLASFKAGTRL